VFQKFWKDKTVLVTGHTGFKGSWLTLILSMMGAKVYGYALAPNTLEGIYNAARIDEIVQRSCIADIRNFDELSSFIIDLEPDFVFHLAAQPLVREAYEAPIPTFAINTMGTVNVLESIRRINKPTCIINVTTDKCYDNKEWVWPYRENDRLGGRDPYSASKACSEFVTEAYKQSFFRQENKYVATARAGNVIGGGDFSVDRLLPDIVKAYRQGNTIKIRNPNATRPWQHVFEPLVGYLVLAEKLSKHGSKYAEAWNFGPFEDGNKPVKWILDRITERYLDFHWDKEKNAQVHESQSLHLDSGKAKSELSWRPRWDLLESLDKTLLWYEAQGRGDDMQIFSKNQIAAYLGAMEQ